jgi:hypothetical protein
MLEFESELSISRIRYRILSHLNDYNNIHPFVSLERDELLKELKISESDLEEGIRYLEDKMLIETVWFMGGDFWTKISTDGVEELFKIEKEPKAGTRFFPPAKLMRGY